MNPLNIPNLPTDNLYKFCAISGLIIILFSITFTVIYVAELQEESILLDALAQEAQVDADYLERANRRAESKQRSIEKLLSGYDLGKIKSDSNRTQILTENIELMKTSKEWRDYLEFTYKYYDKMIPGVEEFKEFEKLDAELVIISKELEYKAIQLNKNHRLSTKKLYNLYFIIFIGVVLVIVGFILAKFGFDQWNKLVQKPNDERILLELEKLRANSENIADSTTHNNV